jgi:hypothetical protein
MSKRKIVHLYRNATADNEDFGNEFSYCGRMIRTGTRWHIYTNCLQCLCRYLEYYEKAHGRDPLFRNILSNVYKIANRRRR